VVRTLDELQDRLDEDLSWRRTEAVALRKQVRAATGRMQEALARAGLALLYAHWEGYTRNSLSRYVDFVARRRLRLDELQPALAVLAAQRRVFRTTGLSDAERLVRLSQQLTTSGQDRAWLPTPDQCVDTRSNLSSEVLSDLLVSLGFDADPYRLQGPFIDYQLVQRRNRIAHGEFDVVDCQAYGVAHFEVLSLLSLTRTCVLNAAVTKQYRR
jgi:hypothetical protein